MAHKFLNYMLNEKVAYDNFVNYVGYQPPQLGINAKTLFEDEVLPPNLRSAVVTREAYANGNAYLTLTPEGQRRWDRGWAKFRTS